MCNSGHLFLECQQTPCGKRKSPRGAQIPGNEIALGIGQNPRRAEAVGPPSLRTSKAMPIAVEAQGGEAVEMGGWAVQMWRTGAEWAGCGTGSKLGCHCARTGVLL
jgi:hypothetical protein